MNQFSRTTGISVTVLGSLFFLSTFMGTSTVDSAEGDHNATVGNRNSLVAAWSFDEVNGHILLDETDRYVAIAKGTSTLTHSGGIAFDGKSGYAIVRHDNTFLLDEGTIACWIEASDVQRTQGIVSKDATGFGDGGHITLSLQAGKVVMRLQSSLDSRELHAPIQANQNTHVAMTFGEKGMQLFVNGTVADSNSYVGGLGQSSGGTGNREPLVVGASTINSQSASEQPLTDFFGGQLDELTIFNMQLSSEEIAELIDAAKPKYDSIAEAYVANAPTAWWRLDDAAGELIAADIVGQQDGSYNAVGSSYFDGDDYVDVGAIDLEGDTFSIATMIRPSSFTVADARIIAKENGLDDEEHFWSLGTTSRNDQVQLRFRLTTSDGTREVVSNARHLHVDESYCVSAVYDGRTMRLYQDGELVGQVKHSGRPKTNAHCHVWIGDTPAGAGKRPFDGSIKELAIFSKALTPDVVKAMCSATRNNVLPPQSTDEVELPAVDDIPEALPLAQEAAPERLDELAPQATIVVQLEPYVPRCPLCGELGHSPIRRVSLYGLPPVPSSGASEHCE